MNTQIMGHIEIRTIMYVFCFSPQVLQQWSLSDR